MYNFNDFDKRVADALERLREDFMSIQTGRATPSVLDNVLVEAYGSRMNISHLASINLEDSKTLLITPYDKSSYKDIEKAINEANLGLSVASGDAGLRVIFPALTTERRAQYVKLAKEKYEEAKIKIKLIREDIKKDIENKNKEKEIGDDDKKKSLEALQNKVDKAHSEGEEMLKGKELIITSQ